MLTLELRDALEVVLLHEGLQPAAQLLDHGVAVQHHARAHLRGRRIPWVEAGPQGGWAAVYFSCDSMRFQYFQQGEL